MTTYFLRFPDEATAQTALEAAGIYVAPIGNNPGYYRQADIGWAFDPIGTITEGGTYDVETGEELVASTVLEGWHVNYIGELPDGWGQYIVSPESPVRKFAGVD
jgi:hypothetical protein